MPTAGSCCGDRPPATRISPPTLFLFASKRWALMSESVLLFTSLQTTTDEPLREVATAAWCCTPYLLVLTRISELAAEGRKRSSSGSHSRRRTGAFCAPVLVPL